MYCSSLFVANNNQQCSSGLTVYLFQYTHIHNSVHAHARTNTHTHSLFIFSYYQVVKLFLNSCLLFWTLQEHNSCTATEVLQWHITTSRHTTNNHYTVNWEPGIVFPSSLDAVLSKSRLPRESVFKNCFSSSLIISMTCILRRKLIQCLNYRHNTIAHRTMSAFFKISGNASP